VKVAVLGAGVAGLATALALARDGHEVVVVERDEVTVGEPLDAPDWPRRGIPHFLQAHSFTSRGRLELKTHFHDVFQALLDAGADDIALWRKLHGEVRPEDDDLAIVGVRGPLIEWALRRSALAEDGISVVSGVRVVGLEADPSPTPIVRGVRTTTGLIEADLVVDAMGRRSPVPDWIESLGGTPMTEESSDCGVISATARPAASRPRGSGSSGGSDASWSWIAVDSMAWKSSSVTIRSSVCLARSFRRVVRAASIDAGPPASTPLAAAPAPGIARSIEAATYVQKVSGSLSLASSGSRATRASSVLSASCAMTVVLPKPAGAETSVSGAAAARANRSSKRRRGTRRPWPIGRWNFVSRSGRQSPAGS
jgi:hypothetical protein